MTTRRASHRVSVSRALSYFRQKKTDDETHKEKMAQKNEEWELREEGTK